MLTSKVSDLLERKEEWDLNEVIISWIFIEGFSWRSFQGLDWEIENFLKEISYSFSFFFLLLLSCWIF